MIKYNGLIEDYSTGRGFSRFKKKQKKRTNKLNLEAIWDFLILEGSRGTPFHLAGGGGGELFYPTPIQHIMHES